MSILKNIKKTLKSKIITTKGTVNYCSNSANELMADTQPWLEH
jgi:hypothetical protein